jgi:hypothetical protein
MKRRDALKGLALSPLIPFLASCSKQPEAARDEIAMYILEIWTDSNPDDFPNSHAIRLAKADLTEHAQYKGLFSLQAPLVATLPSGLKIEATCERVASGDVHFGLSHNGELASMGKYSGLFTVRMFPGGGDSYIADFKLAGDTDAVA